jgi:hypothetical protein
VSPSPCEIRAPGPIVQRKTLRRLGALERAFVGARFGSHRGPLLVISQINA